MPLIFRQNKSGRQPLQGAAVDKNNPLTRNLVFLAMPQHASMVDIVGGRRGTADFFAPPTVTATQDGYRAFLCNGGNTGNSYFNFGTADLVTADVQNGPMTMLVWCAPTAGQGGLIERNDNNTVGAGFMFGIGADLKPKFLKERTTSNSVGTSGLALTAGVPTSIAVTYDGTTISGSAFTFYQGGVLQSTANTATGSGTSGTTEARTLYVGLNSFPGAGSRSDGSLAGNLEFAAIWKRVLSADEIASIHRDRYQLVKPSNQRLFVAASAAAYTLDTTPGAYALTGSDATLTAALVLSSTPGSYALTGASADISTTQPYFEVGYVDPGYIDGEAYTLDSTPGAYVLTGATAALDYAAAAPAPAPPQKRHAGTLKKQYLIKGRRYLLADWELREVIAQMQAEVKRADVLQDAAEPRVLSRKTWAALKASLASLEAIDTREPAKAAPVVQTARRVFDVAQAERMARQAQERVARAQAEQDDEDAILMLI